MVWLVGTAIVPVLPAHQSTFSSFHPPMDLGHRQRWQIYLAPFVGDHQLHHPSQ
jgi:hypothetical protein